MSGDALYEKAGIKNVADFYKDKFVFERAFDFTHVDLNFFDLNYFKFLWFYSQVEPNSRVLDFGCGSGSLACLKQKGCEVVGIDLSEDALEIAQRVNGYDWCYCGELSDFPSKGYFDYVVSVDVLGHIPFEDKDRLLGQLKELLKPGGVMLHGIECGELDYAGMDDLELAAFVGVDGHVGIEPKSSNIQRFKKLFAHVDGELAFVDTNSVDEYVKQVKAYGFRMHPGLLEYLAGLSDEERRAFDVASGLSIRNVFQRKLSRGHAAPSGVSWLRDRLKRYFSGTSQPDPEDTLSGFLFLRASNSALPCVDLAEPQGKVTAANCNLVEDDNVCVKGFYPVETRGDTLFRWGASRCMLRFRVDVSRQLEIELFSSYPGIDKSPLKVYLMERTQGGPQVPLAEVDVTSHAVTHVELGMEAGDHLIEIFCETSWVPKFRGQGDDARTLSVGIESIVLK